MDKQLAALDMTKALSALSSHADLLSARSRTNDPRVQAQLAPLEHRAFAREFATESPLSAAVSLPFAIPAYSGAKAMGLQKARSPASWEEMKQGFMGLGEGLKQSMLQKLGSFGGGDSEAALPVDARGNPVNTQFNLDNPVDEAAMNKRISPEYNTPTKQLGDGTPYGPGAYAKTVRNQRSLGGRGDESLNRSRVEEVAKYREAAGLPSAEEILSRVFSARGRR